MQQEAIEEVTICNAIIMLLLYVDDVVLLPHTLEDAKKFMVVLKNFCMHSGLVVNESKTKVILLKLTIRRGHALCTTMRYLKWLKSLSTLVLTTNYKWHE